MTREEIISAIAAAETTAETLRRLLAEMDVNGTAPPLVAVPRGRPVGISAAMKITGMSKNWVYDVARKCPGVGWQIATGAWRFDADALRASVAPPCAEWANRTERTAPQIPSARETTYLQIENDPKEEIRGSLF